MTTDYRALCVELTNELQGYKVAHPMHCRALLNRAIAALAQPEPVALTDEQWDALKERVWDAYQTIGYQGERFMYDSDFDTALDVVRHKLARYGTPAIKPVPVDERLPGPEELATLVPLMHSGASLCHSEGFYEESDAIGRIADLLEQLMPQAGGAPNV